MRISDLAFSEISITIGNRTFKLTPAQLRGWLIPESFVRWVRRRSSRFTSGDEGLELREPERSAFRTFRIDVEGKWFCCWSWWLFPKSHLKQVRRRFDQIYCRDPNWYQKQPVWSLRDIDTEASSLSKASQITQEFLDSVAFTSEAFDWAYPDLLDHWDLQPHAWKHVVFRDFENLQKATWREKPGFRLDVIGSDKEVRELFRRAAERDPEAVARLSHLFPSAQERREVLRLAKDLFKWWAMHESWQTTGSGEGKSPTGAGLVEDEKIDAIPWAEELAAELALAAIRNPDSEEAEAARRALRRLVSRGAVKGSVNMAGRPPIPFPDEVVAVACSIGYGLSIQLREVDRLLARFEHSSMKRLALSCRFFPWLETLPVDPLSLSQMPPMKAACIITGVGLGLSASQVEKSFYKFYKH